MKRCPKCGFREIAVSKNLRLRSGLALPKTARLKGKNIRRVDCDEAEKKARGYTHPRSVVRHDGSEILYGADWRARKMEVRERDTGLCERVTMLGRSHDAFCRNVMDDVHHIVKRSKFRDDRMSNLAALSKECHEAEDARQVRWTPKPAAAITGVE